MSANFNFSDSYLSNLETSQEEPIVDDQMRVYLDLITHSIIFLFALLGVVTNTINMRVFIFQGFSDSNTIGLFLLAVADFAGCLIEVGLPVCAIVPYLGMRQMYYSCIGWTWLIGHATHMLMSRITCLITVYIAIERCLCVLMPFKVKKIFRPMTTTIAITLIYVMVIGSYIVFYLNTWVGPTFHTRLNITIDIMKQTQRGTVGAYYISFIYNNIISTGAIIIVAIATGLMLYKLAESRKWRKNVSTTKDDSQQKPVSAKEKRDVEVLKMVTMVTGLFIICTIMSHIPGMTIALISGTTPAGINYNLYYVVYAYKVLSDLINSSLNYFFYIKISSKYKSAFNSVFGKSIMPKEPESL